MGKRKTQEEFEYDVYTRLGTNYKLLSPYPGCHGKVLMLHYDCGKTFEKNVHDIISKSSGCPYCNGTKPKLYNEQWVKDNTPAPYKYIKGYTTMKEKCTFYCEKCNSEFEQLPSRLINQKIYGCNCSSTKKLTHEQFLKKLGKECLDEFEVLDKYINIDTKISFRHKKCGTEFKISPYAFISKHNKKYCPICYYKKSHGEIIISTFLNKHQIDYQKEFVFPDYKSKKFDFYLPELNIAIEYDGIQHFEPVDFFGGEDSFAQVLKRDEEKNQYCKNKNIQLFRLPYSEINNLNQILYEILKEKSSTTIEKYLVH